jgi:hypothetical protein
MRCSRTAALAALLLVAMLLAAGCGSSKKSGGDGAGDIGPNNDPVNLAGPGGCTQSKLDKASAAVVLLHRTEQDVYGDRKQPHTVPHVPEPYRLLAQRARAAHGTVAPLVPVIRRKREAKLVLELLGRYQKDVTKVADAAEPYDKGRFAAAWATYRRTTEKLNAALLPFEETPPQC